jgi:hypothetical protein
LGTLHFFYILISSQHVCLRFTLCLSRDIQRLPTTPFSLVLRWEYFDCSQRDSHAVHYITYKRGERGKCLTLLLCSLATVMSCIERLSTDRDKIPAGGTTTYILYSLCLSCCLFLEKVFLLPRVAKLGFGTSPSPYSDT